MTYTCFDDANVAQFSGITASEDVFAGYVDNYQTFPWLEANRAGHRLISISLYGHAADALDIETGGATIDMAPAWFRVAATRKLHTSKPVLYVTAGNSYALVNEMTRSGISRDRYLLWTAHIGRGEHICSPHVCGYAQADGTQWTWTALGRNLDQSVLGDQFFGAGQGPAVTTPLEDDVAYIPTVAKAGDTVPLALPIGTKFVVFSSYDEVELDVWQHSKNGSDKFKLDQKGAYTVKVEPGNRELFIVRRTAPNAIVSAAPSA